MSKRPAALSFSPVEIRGGPQELGNPPSAADLANYAAHKRFLSIVKMITAGYADDFILGQFNLSQADLDQLRRTVTSEES